MRDESVNELYTIGGRTSDNRYGYTGDEKSSFIGPAPVNRSAGSQKDPP